MERSLGEKRSGMMNLKELPKPLPRFFQKVLHLYVQPHTKRRCPPSFSSTHCFGVPYHS